MVGSAFVIVCLVCPVDRPSITYAHIHGPECSLVFKRSDCTFECCPIRQLDRPVLTFRVIGIDGRVRVRNYIHKINSKVTNVITNKICRILLSYNYYPQANSQAESFMKTLMKAVRTAYFERTD